MNDIPYLLRGVQPVDSESSKLTSSSKYLNSAKLRDWAAFILFRKNGPDFPPPAEMHGFSDMIAEQKDFGHIEQMFTEERKQNPKLDAWFTAGRCSNYVIDDFRSCKKGTVGAIFYRWITEGNYDIQVRPWSEPKSQLDFFNLRTAQTHDMEHIICGGGFNFVGELVPYWMRLTNVFKHLENQELAGELSTVHILGQLRYTVRTVLHYPQVWQACVDAMQRGMRVGQESDAIFMNYYEDVFHLPVEEAREALGVRGAVFKDTFLEGEIFAGRLSPEALVADAVRPVWSE